MAFFSTLGGLIAGDPYGSYLKTRQEQTQQAGQQILGKAITDMFNPPVPGGVPIAPLPGQASQSGQPQGLLSQLAGLPQRIFGGGAPGGQAPQGAPMGVPAPGAQYIGAAPQPGQRPLPQGGGQGGGPQDVIGRMSYPQIVQSIARQNVPPEAKAAALQAAVPFMNSMALAQYRQSQLELGQERIGATERGQDIRAGTAARGQALQEYWRAVNAGLIDPAQIPPPSIGAPTAAPYGPGRAQAPAAQAPAQVPAQAPSVAERFPQYAGDPAGAGARLTSDPSQAPTTQAALPPQPGATPPGQQPGFQVTPGMLRMGWDQQTIDNAAQRWLQTSEMPRNIGRGQVAAQITGAVQHRIGELMREQNLTADQVAQNQARYKGDVRAQQARGTQETNVEVAGQEVAQLIPQALEASKNYQRYDITVLNDLYNKWKRGVGDPAFNDFLVANFALANAYSRAMNPRGVPRVAEREERKALGILSEATNQQAYQTQVQRLWKEVQASRKAVQSVREGIGKKEDIDINAPMPGSAPATTTPAAPWKPPPGVTIEKLN